MRTTSSPHAYILSALHSGIFLLDTDLSGKVLGGRVTAGIVRGNMNETINIVLGDSIGDALDTVNVDILVGEVPRTVNK